MIYKDNVARTYVKFVRKLRKNVEVLGATTEDTKREQDDIKLDLNDIITRITTLEAGFAALMLRVENLEKTSREIT